MTTQTLLSREQESFASHTPLRVGGCANRWVWVYSEEELFSIMYSLKKQRWMVHWPFQDVLCREGGFDGTVIRLAGDFGKIHYHELGVTLGSSALWAQLGMGFSHVFADWSGSVGGLFAQRDSRILHGFTRTLRWATRKKIIEETLTSNEVSAYHKKNAILLSIHLHDIGRKRKYLPQKSGEIYSAPPKKDLGKIFTQHQLVGIRLKGWLLCEQHPSRILNLGEGTLKELLVLSQGIKERVYKVSGTRIDLNIPIIGKESKNVE